MQAATSIQARENNVYMKVWRYRHRIEHYGSAGGHRKGTRLGERAWAYGQVFLAWIFIYISESYIRGISYVSAYPLEISCNNKLNQATRFCALKE
ncbi:DEHA2E07194p [Debaryomyces hansenii CBS767]|uniref:DEHA2E07194p n=1 Tax=Debaryomyces hansenii (strain ATCC 36239 / CBS 767 / BCRC 21394 / JCM 1990 / NBRC 0083 / IGC 2968) TaxID=284592 RepID=Q6BQ97_DEBHA|nr:DEHA2E07194p [Debaryomyces hansenii CBS767]CAG87853.2 DEHA2E07194p [Debaryomyces hansenii CBS767]|eukprot:XP_459623.2 DEHA2E07194p [Debaryomyces hansenii CBS767]